MISLLKVADTVTSCLLQSASLEVDEVQPEAVQGHVGEPNVELWLPLEDAASVTFPAIVALSMLGGDHVDLLGESLAGVALVDWAGFAFIEVIQSVATLGEH